jgi:hypothetical protein
VDEALDDSLHLGGIGRLSNVCVRPFFVCTMDIAWLGA